MIRLRLSGLDKQQILDYLINEYGNYFYQTFLDHEISLYKVLADYKINNIPVINYHNFNTFLRQLSYIYN